MRGERLEVRECAHHLHPFTHHTEMHIGGMASTSLTGLPRGEIDLLFDSIRRTLDELWN